MTAQELKTSLRYTAATELITIFSKTSISLKLSGLTKTSNVQLLAPCPFQNLKK